MADARTERLEAWRKRCYLDEVPADFLRITYSSPDSSVGSGQGQTLHQYGQHMRPGHGVAYPAPQFNPRGDFGTISGYLRITVNQVRLYVNIYLSFCNRVSKAFLVTYIYVYSGSIPYMYVYPYSNTPCYDYIYTTNVLL